MAIRNPEVGGQREKEMYNGYEVWKEHVRTRRWLKFYIVTLGTSKVHLPRLCKRIMLRKNSDRHYGLFLR